MEGGLVETFSRIKAEIMEKTRSYATGTQPVTTSWGKSASKDGFIVMQNDCGLEGSRGLR